MFVIFRKLAFRVTNIKDIRIEDSRHGYYIVIKEYDTGRIERVSNYVTEQEVSTELSRVVDEVNDKLKIYHFGG